MCDWRSTAAEDYTASDLVSTVWEGETLQVYHSSRHEWWFAGEMAEDDVLLIKMYDSAADRQGSRTAMCKCRDIFLSHLCFYYRFVVF